jgi:hypothetical protein
VRQPELLDRCKAVLIWCVLGVVAVRALDALERDYAARVRPRRHVYRTSVRRLLLERCDDVINGCVLGITVLRTFNSLERDYTARLRHKSPANRGGSDPMTFSSARGHRVDGSKSMAQIGWLGRRHSGST